MASCWHGAGDKASNLLYRIQNGEGPGEAQPKVTGMLAHRLSPCGGPTCLLGACLPGTCFRCYLTFVVVSPCLLHAALFSAVLLNTFCVHGLSLTELVRLVLPLHQVIMVMIGTNDILKADRELLYVSAQPQVALDVSACFGLRSTYH